MEDKCPCRCRFSAATSWLHTHWQYGTPFLAIYTTFFLLLFVYPTETPLFWIWICLPVYFVHQCEEYLWPGGFMTMLTHRFTKKNGSDPNTLVLSAREAYWINVGIVWALFPASALAAMVVDPIWGLWIPCFTVLNGLSHIIAWMQDRSYNPGLVASLALNIPVGTAAILILTSSDIAGFVAWAAAILIAVGFMAFIAGYVTYQSHNRHPVLH
ncbi:HXXEE domain-containing protein [Methanogenium marinum]|uniref:HXXEE domain-containing protein n=1 Tax=Methanogenium marinum TaxID=348610 RepID=A0A9Q4KTH7_9EURY|nr:HXXEE domain-containing protein [Methanogenium marinum]MDE4908461.1 HXXEE domain-containing protein [Methanogenium marinum]